MAAVNSDVVSGLTDTVAEENQGTSSAHDLPVIVETDSCSSVNCAQINNFVVFMQNHNSIATAANRQVSCFANNLVASAFGCQ